MMDSALRISIDQVHSRLIECAHAIVHNLANAHGVDRDTSGELMLHASQLLRLAPEATKPKWLINLVNDFHGKRLSYQIGGNCAAEFAAFLVSNMNMIESPLLDPDEVLYNFDVTFDEFREAEGIPAAFDRLVAQLQEIIAKDVIDSRVVQETLDRLMALLKRNKHSSLTSIIASMHYGRFALKAFEGVLSANKYLKPMVDAFKVEFEIAEDKVRKAEASLKHEAIRRLVNRERLMSFIEANSDDTKAIAGYLGDVHSEPDSSK